VVSQRALETCQTQLLLSAGYACVQLMKRTEYRLSGTNLNSYSRNKKCVPVQMKVATKYTGSHYKEKE
jgi:hypothetical protein